ncbi:ABC transporter ATP-binding protein (plasmid) [Priestia megaterium]|uniref:ABC transporter family protein n=1 Tax=Priestia megaterium (strain ATCC 14581 / DSM 32 / CCUG 1817 / JCM 2506 / NBRC 15308 / NCIMB 9376 / NCTC 10342 / NRRL B-14308 / VKM B-512 / Ford 19) TaxID=1348623 RepID=A0A0B6AYN1_PRIM2|nr:ABC transporter ATP-binding protein [Priestia megaterium]AJI25818.1 ABC transporter family protein [Priestia megaterium NBRC 15308 = ATCC 14581]KFN07508.1 ABC transporter family protein [Priestia megaterium]KGJ82758.1 bacitracin ABC transporter ATP-binding protein [Priestia megaterium NBRC 15308 = ATCC 14581]MDR4229750.1 ABC transporter ATP-binding protein [Priestia megaterium]MED4399194.1 ABC transporter ATP-binding protein [Priestia megaterium]
MENIIEVRNLTKAFSNKVVLKDINFEVRKGETFGFLGPSGSGKTTTIKILTSQLLHTKGEINIFNQPLEKQKNYYYLKRVGILTDNSTLYDRLSVYDNLLLYCKLYGVSSKRIDEVLKDVNLLKDKKTVVLKLSKGMKQRVVLARALLHKPEILFLDEPTSALDPVNTKHIYEGLKRLNREGTTIFLTTHDMSEAEELCDRVAFLDQGKIKLLDSPRNLRLKFSKGSISLTLKDGKTLTVKNDEEGGKQIYNYITNDELISIHSNEPTLGDIFVQLTGSEL